MTPGLQPGQGLFLASGWRGQYDRLRRSYRRVARGSGDDFDLDLLGFFMHCYHLRDWLINDNAVTKDEVESEIMDRVEMQICRDLCNGHKHLRLDHPSIGSGVFVAREYVPPPSGGQADTEIVVLARGEKYSARELASDCLAIWERFLAARGLIAGANPWSLRLA